MTVPALINPQILTWARLRAGLSMDLLAKKLGLKKVQKLVAWEQGDAKPTFNQAQKIAQITSVPFGYFYLPQPPVDETPIPDLRTVANKPLEQTSSQMRDIIKQVMQKQAWYKEYLLNIGQQRLTFIGRFNVGANIKQVAEDIRKELKVPLPRKGTWQDYHRELIKAAENIGILVMRSGIVGNNTRQKLQVSEFRGFAICDELAPVIFVNSADAPTARLFTLIHEIAHLWIDSSGISDLVHQHKVEESFCNAVAGEFLIGEQQFLQHWDNDSDLKVNCAILSSTFHVSDLVVAKRALDCDKIDAEQYWSFYHHVLKLFQQSKGGGGDFNTNAGARNGKRFSSAVVAEALSGRMLLRDAGDLLGIGPDKIKNYAQKLAL